MNNQNNQLAFVFPGQGSQSIGMVNDLAASYPVVRQVFERASDAISCDLWTLVKDGPIEMLNQTHNTQPAMLAAGFAVWELWSQQSAIKSAWMAGHSLGEYTALVCAGALGFEEALKVIVARGRLMQAAVPDGVGAMAAILGLDDEQVVNVCKQAAGQEIVAAVNFNSPGQVVIAGHKAAVERAIDLAKSVGAKKAVVLPVSVPSHCQLMAEAAQSLAKNLLTVTITTPSTRVIHNVDVATHPAPDDIRRALTDQLYCPVRWAESVQYMHGQGVAHFVEMGPGRVLVGLNKRIVKSAEHSAVYDSASLNQVLEQLHG